MITMARLGMLAGSLPGRGGGGWPGGPPGGRAAPGGPSRLAAAGPRSARSPRVKSFTERDGIARPAEVLLQNVEL